MPYVCRSCNHFDGEAAAGSACSECGGAMRFTMLDPRATATATLEPPTTAEAADWEDTFKYGYDEVEAPWSFRYAQIGGGITAYFVISRLAVPLVLLPFAMAFSEMPPDTAELAIKSMALALYCLAALSGGAVAGFWARNWLPQGLGVAAGVLLIPLVMMLIFAPDNWPRFCLTLALTSALTVVGAYLGHLIFKPTRIPRC